MDDRKYPSKALSLALIQAMGGLNLSTDERRRLGQIFREKLASGAEPKFATPEGLNEVGEQGIAAGDEPIPSPPRLG